MLENEITEQVKNLMTAAVFIPSIYCLETVNFSCKYANKPNKIKTSMIIYRVFYTLEPAPRCYHQENRR